MHLCYGTARCFITPRRLSTAGPDSTMIRPCSLTFPPTSKSLLHRVEMAMISEVRARMVAGNCRHTADR